MSDQLFDPGLETPTAIKVDSPRQRVWSKNKVKVIAAYLRGFVYVTRHGTYIDAFAGPQTERFEQPWAAQLVLTNEPRWMRTFHLFDHSPNQVRLLERLASENSERNVHVYTGDSNRVLPAKLPVGSIREREATLCLLDQRTFECEWQLCEYIARLRPGSMKVEQFYFLANYWMPWSLSSISTVEGEQRVVAWLGQDDWRSFAGLDSPGRVEFFVHKFRTELGYRYVNPWPIYRKDRGMGAVMYYMIHASDHPRAPKLMQSAYSDAVDPPPAVTQLELNL